MNKARQHRISALVFALALATASLAAVAHEPSKDAPAMRAASKGLKVSTVDIAVPPLTLLRDDGKKVSLPHELDDGRPVVLNFIYTTCPGICPVMSQVFS